MFNLITYKTYSGASDAKGCPKGSTEQAKPVRYERQRTRSVAAALRQRRATQPPNYNISSYISSVAFIDNLFIFATMLHL